MPDSPSIHLALRFHVNLYHSYRGDSLDEKGIGKDIRIIRGLLDGLSELEAAGIPVRAAWDIENYYSLELYLPRFAPDIIDRIRARVADGQDEVELMSWNNGLLTAHDGEELREAIARAIHNDGGSGLADLFPSWARIVRPQECMWNAAHIGTYRALGVEAVSLYYSAIPFNGFASFMPVLPLAQRYNPSRLLDRGSGASMRLLPAYNPGDVVEHWASLRHWLKGLRRLQLAEGSGDLLLILDMDADDSFWEGYLPGNLAFLPPSLRGLVPMLRSVASLPFLRFSLPGAYLREHTDAGDIVIGQDLADGSYDGYSSWAEKEENTRLWPTIHEARRQAALAGRIGEEAGCGRELSEALREALTARLLSLSTTHFGMASPVMNAERLRDAFASAGLALAASERALGLALASRGPGDGSWYFDPRIDALEAGCGGIIRLESGAATVANPSSSKAADLGAAPRGKHGSPHGLQVSSSSIRSGALVLEAGRETGLVASLDGLSLFDSGLSRPWIRHGRRKRVAEVTSIEAREPLAGKLAELEISGIIALPAGGRHAADVAAHWTHLYTVAAGVKGFRVDLRIDYPATQRRGFDRAKALRLARDWDARWREVAPFEMAPSLGATPENPVRVWKHDFSGQVASYSLDYHRFGPNREPTSLNNHITDGWVAVAAAGRGILVAQSDEAQTLFAFCPMRVRLSKSRQRVFLNPFGSYAGPQWRYPTATTGFGRLAALAAADNLDPYAPSWEGGSLRSSLFVIPYEGDCPPEAVQRDALIFARRPFHG